jgi:hypothetical protein
MQGSLFISTDINNQLILFRKIRYGERYDIMPAISIVNRGGTIIFDRNNKVIAVRNDSDITFVYDTFNSIAAFEVQLT